MIKGIAISVLLFTLPLIMVHAEGSDQSVLSSISALFKWVKELDSAIEGINDKEVLNKMYRTSGDIRSTLQKTYNDKLELKVLLKKGNALHKFNDIVTDLRVLKNEIDSFAKLVNVSKVRELEDTISVMTRVLVQQMPFTDTQIRQDVFIGASDEDIESDMNQSFEYTNDIISQLKLIEDHIQQELRTRGS